MKKMLLFALIFCLLISLNAASADGNKVEPGMSAFLERGAYYGVGTDIPEGSYIFTCPDREETDWNDVCDVLVSTYDILQINEEMGMHINFPETDDGYGSFRSYLGNGKVIRIRYSGVKITAAEKIVPEQGKETVLSGHANYGVGYDIPEGTYLFHCVQDGNLDYYDNCTVSISSSTPYIEDDMSYSIYIDSYDESDTIMPSRIFLQAGTILSTHGTPVTITPADPIEFK